MSEITFKTEIGHHVFNMPLEYFQLKEIQDKFTRTRIVKSSRSDKLAYYVGTFVEEEDGFINRETTYVYSIDFEINTLSHEELIKLLSDG